MHRATGHNHTPNFLQAIVRPISVLAGLMGTRTPWTIRSLMAWFGVRGLVPVLPDVCHPAWPA